MPTVGYLRCSTDAQDTLRQREDIERSGIKIDHWLEDHESRDKAHKRPDFQRLLKAVQAGQVDTIVVQVLDRFGTRDTWQQGSFFTILKDHNCRLLDASGKQLNADDVETVILDYLTEVKPQVKAFLDAMMADNLEAAKPLLPRSPKRTQRWVLLGWRWRCSPRSTCPARRTARPPRG